jgi:hypothetical protein
MPSPTRTITPQESPMQQTKRKLESTVSTENATGGAKKKEKPISEQLKDDPSKSKLSIPEVMEIDMEKSSPREETKVKEKKVRKKKEDEQEAKKANETAAAEAVAEKEEKTESVQDVQESLKKIEELCDELMEKTDKNNKIDEKPQKQIDVAQSTPTSTSTIATTATTNSSSSSSSAASAAAAKVPSPVATSKVEDVKKDAVKKISSPVKRDMVKHKTSDLSGALSSLSKESEKAPTPQQTKSTVQVSTAASDRKNSLPEEAAPTAVSKPTPEKRRSRILETAEKFQNMNNQNNEKYKKFSIPGVSVGSFKKEFERKASLTDANNTATAANATNNSSNKKSIDTKRDSHDNNTDVKKVPQDVVAATANRENDRVIKSNSNDRPNSNASSASRISDELTQSDSKNSVHSFSLEEARRSMENSIAMLQRAKNESRSKDVDNLCAKTESFTLQQSDSNNSNDREKKLQAARDIIGMAIPPSRLIGIRKPPMIYGLNGRSVSGGVIQTPSTPQPFKSTNSSLGRFSSNDSNSKVVPESVRGKLAFVVPSFLSLSFIFLALHLERKKNSKVEKSPLHRDLDGIKKLVENCFLNKCFRLQLSITCRNHPKRPKPHMLKLLSSQQRYHGRVSPRKWKFRLK